MKSIRNFAALAALLAPAALFSPALADAGHGHEAGFGEPGSAAAVSRTITVSMGDNFYEPERIEVKAGETIRFKVTNAGELVHEFQIGTPESFEEHAPMMQMMVDHGVLEADRINWQVAEEMQASMGHGMHDEPNSVLLEPGKSGEVIWKFPASGSIDFACTMPGHYESGMEGAFDLTN